MSTDPKIRAERLMNQVMKTWDPPLLTGAERPADIAQTSTMIAIAFIMGREFMPAQLTDNQRSAIEGGLKLMKRVLNGPLQITERKWYERRDGETVGPSRLERNGLLFKWRVGGKLYPDNGRYAFNKTDHPYDLIHEVPEPKE